MKKFLPILLFLVTTGAVLTLPHPVYAAGTMYLDPASKKVKLNDVFNVKIMIDTMSSQAVGGAAIINYDTNLLEVQDADLSKSGVQIGVGQAFNKEPILNLVDPTTGKITLDYGNLQSPVTGVAEFGNISFRAKNNGSAQVRFAFNPSSSTGTSSLSGPGSNNNLLTSITDGNYAISSDSLALGAPGDVATESSTTVVETEESTTSTTTLPETGIFEVTLMMLGLAGMFLIGGLGVYRASR